MRDGGIVVGGIGIRHCGNGGKPAGDSSAPSSGYRLRFFRAGLAQMDVNVEKSGSDNKSGGIECRDAGNVGGANRADFSTADHEVRDGIDVSRGIDEPSIPYQQIHEAPSRRHKMAMRTPTPAA